MLIINRKETQKIFGIIFIILIISNNIFSQQEKLFSNYMLNPSSINPGYTGTRGVNTFYFQARNQWMGIEGAPVTRYFNFQNANQDSNIGFGLNFTDDKLGIVNNTEISLDFATYIQLNEFTFMSVGIRNGFNSVNLDLNQLNQYQPDPMAYDIGKARFNYNLGFGIFIFNESLYFGISIPNVTEKYVSNGLGNNYFFQVKHSYLVAGKILNLNDDFALKPSIMARKTFSSKLQMDLTLNALFNEKFQLGGGYRTNNAMNFMLGYQHSKNIFVGYSYDIETTKLGKYSNGSHEIYLRYEFGKKIKIFNLHDFSKLC